MDNLLIHTINARGNIMFEVVRDHFNLNSEVMQKEIIALLVETKRILSQKGIKYEDLKSALTPNPKKLEIALFFDTLDMEESWYGLPIHTKLISLFSKTSNHSVLVGDYIGDNDQQELLFDVFSEKVNLIRNVNYKHSTQFYVIYLNNLSSKMFADLTKGFSEFPPYVGYADLTYSSRLKTCLSTMLVNCHLKHKNIILMEHEDDRNNSEDINLVGYPFEEYGFTCKSIRSYMYGPFLTYKIERPVIKGFEVDTEFSMNAVNKSPLPLTKLEIIIDESKLGYLEKNKTESLKKMGLLGSGLDKLRNMIRSKIDSNYIFNLSYDKQHNTTKFNILLEVGSEEDQSKFCFLVALEYIPLEKSLRLITLY